jgi:hypothetical protein
MNYNDFIGSINQEELLEILPTGLTSPAATLMRARAYGHVGTRKSDLIQHIRASRNDESYSKNAGHKRNVLMVHLSIVVSAVQSSGVRALSPGMIAMINTAFNEDFRSEYVRLYQKPLTKMVVWRKDGRDISVQVCDDLANDQEILQWISVTWA